MNFCKKRKRRLPLWSANGRNYGLWRKLRVSYSVTSRRQTKKLSCYGNCSPNRNRNRRSETMLVSSVRFDGCVRMKTQQWKRRSIFHFWHNSLLARRGGINWIVPRHIRFIEETLVFVVALIDDLFSQEARIPFLFFFVN